MGKLLIERLFGEPFKGRSIPFGAMVEYHPVSANGVKSPPFWEESSTWNIPRICIVCGEGDIMVADIEALGKNKTRQKSTARRPNTEEVVTSKKGGHVIFPVADGTDTIAWKRNSRINSEAV